MKRPIDPFHHKSKMTAKAILIRAKAELAQNRIHMAISQTASPEIERNLSISLTKLNEIIDLVEEP